MRANGAVLFACLLLTAAAGGAEPALFEDAALNAVQFVDRQEGWAVGDEGVIWHTIDGGQSWERQPTGVRASLRAVHFLTPYTGWAAGREELPNGNGSAGVLLFTQDGGLKWRQASRYTLPGLNVVRFLDDKVGFVAGDGSDQFPTGVFRTEDRGRTWKPVAGPRSTGWRSADFSDAANGVLAGAWDRLGIWRNGTLTTIEDDALGGRGLRAVHSISDRVVAVGPGGLVLIRQGADSRWTYPDLHLPTEVRAAWDFRAVHCQGQHIWIAGRPGSALLHSTDKGETWEAVKTGQPLPSNGIFFIDDNRGWAVGELGSVLHTEDGGKTWRVERRGGQRAAILFVHARADGLPVDSIACLGGQEGYLVTGIRVMGPDLSAANPTAFSEGDRFAAAVRLARGASGEMLWQFPLPQHLALSERRELLKAWDRMYADQSVEELLRQLVLALRIWRPEVVITDPVDPREGLPTEGLIAEVMREAFRRAADASAFPEQLQTLGLEAWAARKLYARSGAGGPAHVTLDVNEPLARLGATARDFAAPAASLLTESPPLLPIQRFYRLLDSRVEGAEAHRDLMDGTMLAGGGVARRDLKPLDGQEDVTLKAVRMRRNLQALAEHAGGDLADPGKALGQVGSSLAALPDDAAAAAAFAVASQYARMGQWEYAREIFLMMADRYPAHPLSADACRWLIRHNCSSEAKRRHELGQFVVVSQISFQTPDPSAKVPPPELGKSVTAVRGDVAEVRQQRTQLLGDRKGTRQWYQGCLDISNRLAAFGPLYASDPAIGFCLQSAKRNLGDVETPRRWYTEFCRDHPTGPWHDAAAAELWLLNRSGPPPKPVANCRRVGSRPFLDANLDDACWQGVPPLGLRDAVGETAKQYPTEAWLACDKEYLYLALRCRHPVGKSQPAAKDRGRDADLRPYDRVSLFLDLDRDYNTCFHLQVDLRGCVCEDCWGDRTWNPRWFVASKSEPDCWRIEAAIPLSELTGDTITVGRAWACNIVRILPGRGVQAWSTPADVQPRPEGMGLLLFGKGNEGK